MGLAGLFLGKAHGQAYFRRHCGQRTPAAEPLGQHQLDSPKTFNKLVAAS